tara:strand:- start:29 stop:466 length:438 start_codon:yes stop_codon:yes gene_type:complete
MAKRFERPEDIARELKAVKLFTQDREDLKINKLNPHEIDFSISQDGRAVAYIEIKGVKKVGSVHDEHTPIVAIKKLTSLQKYVNEKKCSHVYIAWAYADGIKYAKVTDLKGIIRWGGQFKPRAGSVNDHELMFEDNGTEFTIKTY